MKDRLGREIVVGDKIVFIAKHPVWLVAGLVSEVVEGRISVWPDDGDRKHPIRHTENTIVVTGGVRKALTITEILLTIREGITQVLQHEKITDRSLLGRGVGLDRPAIGMYLRGLRPTLITFADVGGEKQGTYDFIPLFMQWLADRDFPRPVICEYKPQDKTRAKYRQAVEAVAHRLQMTLSEVQLARMSRLFGNMVANETLPGIAFGMKTCSIKWKVEAQEPH